MRKLHSSGFTLIEILLGMAIFSVIAASLYGIFASTLIVGKKQRATGNYYAEARDALALMAGDMGNAAPFNGDSRLPTTGSAGFDGKEDSVEILVSMDDGIRKVRYSLWECADPAAAEKTGREPLAQCLVREERLFLPGGKEAGPGDGLTEVLSRKVIPGSLVFQYAFIDTKEPGGFSWKSTWQEAYFPGGIRVNMMLQNPESADAPAAIQRDIIIPRGIWRRKELPEEKAATP